MNIRLIVLEYIHSSKLLHKKNVNHKIRFSTVVVYTYSPYRHRTALFVERKVARIDLAHDDVGDESVPPDEAVAVDVGHEQLHRPLVRADAADRGGLVP